VLRSWRTWVIGVPALALVVWLSLAFDVQTVHREAERLNDGVAFVCLTVLPLVGFPVSVLHVAAGLKFGVPLGLALVAASILLQLLASYGLVHWRRNYFERKFVELRRRLPPGSHGPVILFTLLLPGVPYFAKNYVLPMAGVPLRTYLLWCFPIHTLRASVAVVVGDLSDHLTPGRIAALAVYTAAILASTWWAFRRLKAQVADRRSAAGGPSTPA
jgi:uncharacterized membrane protein YdjX (TVP38/TMEM64 family)